MKIEFAEEEMVMVITSVRLRAQSCHNMADESTDLRTTRSYRNAGNRYFKLHEKLSAEFLNQIYGSY